MIVKVVMPDWEIKKIELPAFPARGDDIQIGKEFYEVDRRMVCDNGDLAIKLRFPMGDSDADLSFFVVGSKR